MWRSIGRIDRLATALTYRGIDPEKIDISDLEGTLVRRGITDAKLSDVCDILLHYLEPPSCQMSHCESHGVDGFCRCCDNLVPSKCKKHRDFLKRNKAKATKSADWLLEIKETRYNNILINYDMNAYQFFTGLERVPGFELIKKWSYRLREDTWKEVKRRNKSNGQTKENN